MAGERCSNWLFLNSSLYGIFVTLFEPFPIFFGIVPALLSPGETCICLLLGQLWPLDLAPFSPTHFAEQAAKRPGFYDVVDRIEEISMRDIGAAVLMRIDGRPYHRCRVSETGGGQEMH